jgi:hypothetical protein
VVRTIAKCPKSDSIGAGSRLLPAGYDAYVRLFSAARSLPPAMVRSVRLSSTGGDR